MPFPNRLLAENETIVFDLRPHWIEIVPAALWSLVFLALAIVGYRVADSVFDTQGSEALAENVIVIAALIGWFLLAVIPFLRWRFTLFVLTSDRLITRRGIIAKHSKEIPLERVNDVTFSQRILERMVGAGDLIIESAGERGQNVIGNVRKPEEVQLMVYKQIEDNNTRMYTTAGRTAAQGASDGSPTEQLEALGRLRDQGVLTEAEFEAKKQELLKRF